MRVGYFPYKPGGNPYQALFAKALETRGVAVNRIAPRKLFPLARALFRGDDLLQMDWPHDWYEGRAWLSKWLKRAMYEQGLAQLRRKPCVWTVHNLTAHDTRDAIYDRRMIQKLIDCCDGLILLSRHSEMALRERYRIPDKTRVLITHHGHYMDVYPAGVERQKARELLGLPAMVPVVLSLGRLLPYKGLEELIQAFHSFDHGEARLLLAGSCGAPGYLDKLEKVALESERFPGQIRIDGRFIADDELQNYFAAADVVVLPFRRILNSGSLLLAMSFGKCVVAPDAGSIAEIACPAGWFSYSMDERESLGAALAAALGCSDLQVREAEVRQFTADRYSWNRVGEKVAALYRDIL